MLKKLDITHLYSDCISLVLFRDIRKNLVFSAFEKVLDSLKIQDGAKSLSSWVDFLAELSKTEPQLDWKSFCTSLLLQQDNAYTRSCESGTPNSVLLGLCCVDLQKIENIACVQLERIEKTIADLRNKHELPQVPLLLADLEAAKKDTSKTKAKKSLIKKTKNVAAHKRFSLQEERFASMQLLLCTTTGWHTLCEDLQAFWRNGVGVFALSTAFVWKNARLTPAENCNAVPLASLYGYDLPRSIVLENTLRFIRGNAANNLLLYGDCGTGKSATVKSIAFDFALSDDLEKNRLRIVEVRKEQLNEFLLIAEQLSKRAFRFIVFIDDLSFNEVDERYIGLKALLEGSLESRPDNVVLYATSNRRHLVKEKAADRVGLGSLDRDAEIRAEDAVQEHLSLSERFGMTVIFSAPDQDEYLAVVFGLVTELNQKLDTDFIRVNALRWSTWYNGRSPRTARHFVDWLSAGKTFPWDLAQK